MRQALLIGFGGFLGANARYWIGGWVEAYASATFPAATLVINLSGSLLLGLLMSGFEIGLVSQPVRLALGVGFLGAYTTFSTFTHETIRLIETGHVATALWYTLSSVIVGLAACFAGLLLGRQLS